MLRPRPDCECGDKALLPLKTNVHVRSPDCTVVPRERPRSARTNRGGGFALEPVRPTANPVSHPVADLRTFGGHPGCAEPSTAAALEP